MIVRRFHQSRLILAKRGRPRTSGLSARHLLDPDEHAHRVRSKILSSTSSANSPRPTFPRPENATRYWTDPDNRRVFLEWFAKENKMESLEDWYKFKTNDIEQWSGGSMLSHYKTSLPLALLDLYPDHKWQVWKFGQVPKRWWSEIANQRDFLDFIGPKLGVQKLEDWYSVSAQSLRQSGAFTLVSREYRDSVYAMLKSVYPEHDWIPWKFDKVPSSFWANKANQRWFWHWLADQLKIARLEQWYDILDKNLVVKHGGAGLLAASKSMIESLIAAYASLSTSAAATAPTSSSSVESQSAITLPQHKWHIWKFKKAPRNFWKHQIHRASFVEWVAEDAGYANKEQWYQLTKDQLVVKGGLRVLEYHKSMRDLLVQLFPDHKWLPWKFREHITTQWRDVAYQREYLDWLYGQLNLDGGLAGWYQVQSTDIQQNDGASFLIEYRGSLSQMLMAVYPEHKWEEWRFSRLPQRFWHDTDNQRRYFDALMKELGYTKLTDWYSISRATIMATPALYSVLSAYYGTNLPYALRTLYPEHGWDEFRFVNLKSTREEMNRADSHVAQHQPTESTPL